MNQPKKYLLQKPDVLLPVIEWKKSTAVICNHCNTVNAIEFSFCTNCGYPLKDELLVTSFYKKLEERKNVFLKAENAVFVARVILYVMASCLLIGILFLFSAVSMKYVIAMIAITLSGLFFFLAFWSRYNPFPALFTAFLFLITFSAINIFSKLALAFTTLQGFISMLLCISLLVVIMKGVQGAYRLTFIKPEVCINERSAIN